MYHEQGPVLVDDLRLGDCRTVVVDDPVQLSHVRPSSQLTRHVDVALSDHSRRVHATQHQHVYATHTQCSFHKAHFVPVRNSR